VFLDSAASAQKPRQVIHAMVDVMEQHYANVNRGVYLLSEEVTGMLETSREKVAKFIGASSSSEIVFTRNASESINLVMYSWARKNLKKGDVIVVSEMEHHSNSVPWQMLRDEIGVELVWIGVTDQGYLDWKNERIQRLGERIKLVAVTHVSNVLGTINPISEIAQWVHSLGARILVDGAQGVTNVSVNVVAHGVDWYVFSGHKLYGPSGVGVLYAKKELLDEMPPFMGGGDMILEVTKEKNGI
jgi:cysteine desulfurase/selenocysteine lyase